MQTDNQYNLYMMCKHVNKEDYNNFTTFVISHIAIMFIFMQTGTYIRAV